MKKTLQWRHNESNGVSNHQPHDCLLNCLFRRRSKETSKLRVTGLCGGNSPVTGEFPAQRASNAENISIWWSHHVIIGSQISTGHCRKKTLQWRHNGRDGVSNHLRLDCLFSRLSRRRSKKTSKLRVTGLCDGNPWVIGGFPTQRASDAEKTSIWWRHHELGELGNKGYPSETHLKPNSCEISFAHNFFLNHQIILIFCTELLLCFMQNFKMIGQLKRMLWTKNILRDLDLRCVSDGCPLLHNARESAPLVQSATFICKLLFRPSDSSI